MIVGSRSFYLKDGRCAVIRSPGKEDIPGILAWLRKTAEETEFIMRYPEECTDTPEDEQRLITQINDSERDVMLICAVNGVIAGNCLLKCGRRIKDRHRASVSIAILHEFWDQGIGTRLFQELIRIAAEDPYVLQMELEFVEGNERARHLYEKMGFRLVGVHPDAIRLKDGSMRNEYLMIRKSDC